MASEITDAEVKFKNASPAAVVEVPPEKKKHEHCPWKYPPWLPWLISLLLVLVCIALIVVLLDQPNQMFWPTGMWEHSRRHVSWSTLGQTLLTNHRLTTAARHCLVMMPFAHVTDQPTTLQQNFVEWWCISAVPQDKGRGWMCCPKGWKRFQGSCYYLSDDMMNWTESNQNCTGMGSHLVVINSEAEQDFLTTNLKESSKGENYYIGLSAQKVGQWQWVDQTPLNEKAAFWRTHEPSNVDAETCVVIHVISEIHNWNDVPCKEHHRICEAAAVTV